VKAARSIRVVSSGTRKAGEQFDHMDPILRQEIARPDLARVGIAAAATVSRPYRAALSNRERRGGR
jgi:hypothetical protein